MDQSEIQCKVRDKKKSVVSVSSIVAASCGGDNCNGDDATKVHIMDFDEFLPHVGAFGRYQLILFVVMIPFCCFFAFVYFAQMFITLVPDRHWCYVPELDLFNLTDEERIALSVPIEDDGEFSRCIVYDVNFTAVLESGQRIRNTSWPVKKCDHGWTYDLTDIPYSTISTELNWVCDKSFLPNAAQSIFYVGAIVGGLLFGYISDNYGRVPALVGCTVVGGVAGIASIYVNNFRDFAICRFFVGFAYDNVYTMFYILIIEYVGPKWRTVIANMSIAIFFTAPACSLPSLALYLLDWRMFSVLTSIPLLFAVFTPFIVPESARWLVSQGKIDRAVEIMQDIAKINRRQVDSAIYEQFTSSCKAIRKFEATKKRYSILDVLALPRLRKILILLIIMWMTISLVFDGHARNVGSLGLDLFVTHTIGTATELPSDLLLVIMIDKWGRRWPSVGALVLGGLFSLFATVVPYGAYSASLAILGRASANFSYNLGCQYAAELLPTVVRGQGIALIHIMGYVASIVAPLVVYLANYSKALPLLILGVIGIIGGLFCLFLPESLNCELPQTLSDGEEFGRHQPFWSFPCCGNDNETGQKGSEDRTNIIEGKSEDSHYL